MIKNVGNFWETLTKKNQIFLSFSSHARFKCLMLAVTTHPVFVTTKRKMKSYTQCWDSLKVLLVGGRRDAWARLQTWNFSDPAKSQQTNNHSCRLIPQSHKPWVLLEVGPQTQCDVVIFQHGLHVARLGVCVRAGPLSARGKTLIDPKTPMHHSELAKTV